MWIFSLQIYRAMSSFTVKAFAAYFTSAQQLNNEKVSNPPGRCYLASGSKGSPEKILTIWIVREIGSRAVFELFIRPGIGDLEAAPLESPAAPPSSQGSRLSEQHQIFHISKILAKIEGFYISKGVNIGKKYWGTCSLSSAQNYCRLGSFVPFYSLLV